MSHPETSTGVASRPRFGPSPARTGAISAIVMPSTAHTAELRVHIFHLPARRDTPRLDSVVVVEELRAFVAHELVARWLDRARLVDSAALEHGRPAVPSPRHAKARQGLGQHRLAQRRLAPGLTTVSRHFHFRDFSGTRPGQAGDLVEPRSLQHESG